MPGRKYEPLAAYRYGFNGKENDNEVKGERNQQDYGMRIYDPRVGRFLSVDPLAIEYPFNSTYIYSEDEPVSNIDLDGLEKVKSTGFMQYIGQGMKKGINEFTGGIRNTSKAIMSKQTYRQGWNNAKEFGKVAMKDPNAAVRIFNKEAYNFSIGISNTIQNYTTQPVMWTMNIPNRSREQNLVGVGYGLWKGGELYVMFLAPELFDGGEGFVPKSGARVDLMGGSESSLGSGWLNFDLKATKGIADDVVNFGQHYGKNTVEMFVVNNPQAEFLQYISGALKDGGTIIVRGNLSNKFFRSIYYGNAKGIENFEVTELNPNVPNRGYKKSTGEDIKGEIHEVLLKKKTKKG